MSYGTAQQSTFDATSDSTPPSSAMTAWKGHYPLEECLRMYCPETELAKEEKRKQKREASKAKARAEKRYDTHGINLLNRESLEICEIEERIKRRKTQHTKVERRRREFINNSIATLSTLLPPSHIDHSSANARGLILQKTIHYISALKEENANLKYELERNKML